MLKNPFLWRVVPAAALVVLPLGLVVAAVSALLPLPTTLVDFEQPGTQPSTISFPLLPTIACSACHAGYDEAQEPFTRWSASMMAQALRDPVFHACLSIAEQDAPAVGDTCIRCHSPTGWLEGRSTPTDGSALAGKDFEGVACHFCHRMVDPVLAPENPAEDKAILAGLGTPAPVRAHNGTYVVDPEDLRRGPFDLGVFAFHEFRISPFHRESLLCGTCHDVSNSLYVRVGGATPAPSDTYVLDATNAPHPTQNKYDEFPIERTYSEWLMSDFAKGPIDLGGLFGGNKSAVSSCQDCHMPDTSGVACAPGFGGDFRDDLPQHDFNGANSWVLNAVLDLDQSLALYGPTEVSGLDQATVDASLARNFDLLRRASDTTLVQDGNELVVRITNNTGHKLPTGYPEGRRMWINVRFQDAAGALVAERGAYDPQTALLSSADTVVYEAKLGLDALLAQTTGLPPGESFHFALNNTIVKDNRIPPRGFTNARFAAIQAAPVGATYADGQFFDETRFAIPCGAASVVVSVFHQTTSKEYVEFLRDENKTDQRGQLAFDLWAANGKSAPVEMDREVLAFAPRLVADVASLSISAGGAQALCVTATGANAGSVYLVLGTVSGTTPGFPVDGLVLPLNLDAYTFLTLTSPNGVPLAGSLGILDPLGNAQATFALPPGLALPAGLVVNHAYVVFNGFVTAVSNATSLVLTP